MENHLQRQIYRKNLIHRNLKEVLLNPLYFLIFLNHQLRRNQRIVITLRAAVQGTLVPEMNLEAEVEAKAVTAVAVAAALVKVPFLMLIKKVNQAKVVVN